MAIVVIPTSELTPENVPSPEDGRECARFALTFDGYGFAGGGVEELRLHLEKIPQKDGVWDLDRITVDDVRADLFMEQRAVRWNYQRGDEEERAAWDRFQSHAVLAVRVIRHLLFGEPRPE